jgi:hypothetical protein
MHSIHVYTVYTLWLSIGSLTTVHSPLPAWREAWRPGHSTSESIRRRKQRMLQRIEIGKFGSLLGIAWDAFRNCCEWWMGTFLGSIIAVAWPDATTVNIRELWFYGWTSYCMTQPETPLKCYLSLVQAVQGQQSTARSVLRCWGLQRPDIHPMIPDQDYPSAVPHVLKFEIWRQASASSCPTASSYRRVSSFRIPQDSICPKLEGLATVFGPGKMMQMWLNDCSLSKSWLPICFRREAAKSVKRQPHFVPKLHDGLYHTRLSHVLFPANNDALDPSVMFKPQSRHSWPFPAKHRCLWFCSRTSSIFPRFLWTWLRLSLRQSVEVSRSHHK